MRDRGGILIFLLMIIILIGGGFFVFKKALDSVPNEPLYGVKGVLEELQLATTELDRGQRALRYVDFVDRRLDELVKIENRGGTPKELLNAALLFWEKEQKAIKELQRQPGIINFSEAKKKLLSVNQKAVVIFNRILDKTPEPEFYSILEIKNKIDDVTQEYSRN